ncbi:hypothetical protein BKA62DRAFT_760208 [Auriculariales sp. MPI-PUGE-AT-0066]|nr:hypothetical protein BKA62DRAFT_760208 [Auriculariales sp. MPI-PUGE-AT-0066]
MFFSRFFLAIILASLGSGAAARHIRVKSTKSIKSNSTIPVPIGTSTFITPLPTDSPRPTPPEFSPENFLICFQTGFDAGMRSCSAKVNGECKGERDWSKPMPGPGEIPPCDFGTFAELGEECQGHGAYIVNEAYKLITDKCSERPAGNGTSNETVSREIPVQTLPVTSDAGEEGATPTTPVSAPTMTLPASNSTISGSSTFTGGPSTTVTATPIPTPTPAPEFPLDSFLLCFHKGFEAGMKGCAARVNGECNEHPEAGAGDVPICDLNSFMVSPEECQGHGPYVVIQAYRLMMDKCHDAPASHNSTIPAT